MLRFTLHGIDVQRKSLHHLCIFLLYIRNVLHGANSTITLEQGTTVNQSNKSDVKVVYGYKFSCAASL